MKREAVMVVLSGGQDSTTCLLEAKRLYNVVHAITFDYGQRHQREIDAAVNVANLIGVDSHEIVYVNDLLRGSSPLVNQNSELETYTDHDSMAAIIGDRVEKTFVPLRNPFFLLVAANYALALGCTEIMTGVCASDNANYPDCTATFIDKMEGLINEALGAGNGEKLFTVVAPLLHLDKRGIVELAMSHGARGRKAMALTHTCYAGMNPPCGECHSCVLRTEGFRLAGVPDPLTFGVGEL